MTVIPVSVGPLATNCYLVVCNQTKKAMLIDPGDDADLIRQTISRTEARVELIVNTHGHYDHIGANNDFSEPLAVHEADLSFLNDPELNFSFMSDMEFRSRPADRILHEDDQIKIGELTFRVIHTPGHTPGGICLYTKGYCFSGDTLFFPGIGRTDLPYGSMQDLAFSLQNKLFGLPDETMIYPGHGGQGTLNESRAWVLKSGII